MIIPRPVFAFFMTSLCSCASIRDASGWRPATHAMSNLKHACMGLVHMQIFMNLATTALIVLDLSWVEDAVIQSQSTGYSSLTRALVLASQAGRMTRLLRVMRLVQLVEVCPQLPAYYACGSCNAQVAQHMHAQHALACSEVICRHAALCQWVTGQNK